MTIAEICRRLRQRSNEMLNEHPCWIDRVRVDRKPRVLMVRKKR